MLAKMLKKNSVLLAAVFALGFCSAARATVLFEDNMYWRPGGVTELNPVSPPTDAYVKIEETVFDDAGGRAVLSGMLSANKIHGNGGLIPATPINVYGYTISNLNYGDGPFTGVGAGIGGFHIPNLIGPNYVMYAPTTTNDGNWAEDTIVSGFYGWDIDANGNRNLGDGVGIQLGGSHNSYYLVVPAGTPHGFINDAEIHTWTGAGSQELPTAVDVDYVYGFVSGPVPEPATLGLTALAGLALAARRRRNK